MLRQLHISNYALIDNVDVEFAPGFNVITGETGAGKSIMLGALGLILGGRADSRVVTDPQRKAVVEATFDITEATPLLRQYCQENDIEWDEARCILRREVSIGASGRSRAFVNDSPVPLAKLQGVAEYLIDIHSQHQNQLLARPEFQLRVIDALAGNADRLVEFSHRYNAFRRAVLTLKKAQKRIEQAREDEEYMRYQLEQLNDLDPQPGEQEALEQEREVLSNIADYKQHLEEALSALNDDDAILSLLSQLQRATDGLEAVLNHDDNVADRLESINVELRDIADALAVADDTLGHDPRRLEYVDQRLNTIYALQRKHHVDTVEALCDLRADLVKRLADIDNADDTVTTLKRDARRARDFAMEIANEISQHRHAAAEQFGAKLCETAKPLGMKNLTVDIQVKPADLSAMGVDSVDFLFAFNKNQTPMSVAGVASGGEISRLMLCVKAIVADAMQLPSIIFDEIDTGVSGDVAQRMGRLMRKMSHSLQVTTITHLPQVAASAAHHMKVYKADDQHSTHTHLSVLSHQERRAELALMLSGDATNAAALATADTLLNNP